jgi:DNA-binding LytR/AlgR family response regulator
VLRSTVDDFLQQLSPERFIKIGRSYIINLYFVNAFDQEFVEINGTNLKISSSHRSLFLERIKAKK